jgi:hypothetical protein
VEESCFALLVYRARGCWRGGGLLCNGGTA